MGRFMPLSVLLIFGFLFVFTSSIVNADYCTGSYGCCVNSHRVCDISGNCTYVCDERPTLPCFVSGPGSCAVSVESITCVEPEPNFTGSCQYHVSCTGDGACKGSAPCCSGSSFSDSSCGSGIRCGTPSSPPSSGGGGSCPCSNWCTGGCPSGYTQTNYCGGNCSSGLVACIDSASCGGGGGGGGGGIPKKTCGQSCSSDSECNNPSAAGVTTACRGGICVNLACWSSGGTTVPGANCDCQGDRQCGQTCGASVGINCTGGSVCTYVNAPGGACGAPGPYDTYCIGTTDGTHTANANLNRFVCNGGGNSYLKNISTGQTTGFSGTDILSTCTCMPPDSITTPISIPNGGTVNAAQTFQSGHIFNTGTCIDSGGGNYCVLTKRYSVTFTWGSPAGGYGGSGPTGYEDGVSGTSYDIEIVPEDGDCSSPAAYCLYNTTIRYHSYTFAPKTSKYKVRLRNYDARCNLAGPWTDWTHFTVTGLPVSGAVFLDDSFYGSYSSQSNACTTGANTPPYVNGKKVPGKLEVVDAPGLLGSYYNAYTAGNGPTGGDTLTINGITYFGGTARTAYEIGFPSTWTNYNGMGMGDPQGYHGTLAMPGMSDGPGAVVWTGKVRPTSSGTYCFTANICSGADIEGYRCDLPQDGWAAGFQAWMNGTLLVSSPNPWGSRGNISTIVSGCGNMNAGSVYDIKLLWYKSSYNSSFFLTNPSLWQQSVPNPYPGTPWYAQGASPNALLTPFQPGSGSSVRVSEGANSASDTVSGGYYTSGENITGGGSIALNPGDTSYGCTCPSGCTYTGNKSPIYGKDFYVTKMANAWFQAIGGNLITNGSITSKAPSGIKAILDGAGGFPGDALYGGSVSPSGANLSSKGWNGKSTYQGKTFDYAYFNSIIPGSATLNSLGSVAGNAELASGTASNGYYWYQANGDLTTSGDILISGNRKVILYVNGNLNINGKINIQTPGSGFFMAIVSGNINVGGTVTAATGPALEGIYISSGSFDSGTGNTQLYVRGSVVAYGGISMRRNLAQANATTPGEKFEYAPDLIMLFPPDLAYTKKIYNEAIP